MAEHTKNTFSVEGEQTLLNGRPFLAVGLRCSNALYSDATTEDLIAHLDEYRSYGLNTVSVFFMGNRFGDIKGYNEDTSLSETHTRRMIRIIREADKRDMVVLVGCLYWGNSKSKWESWTQADANRAVATTVAWLRDNGLNNTFVDPDNEGMGVQFKEFDDRQLVVAAKEADPWRVVAYNYHGEPPLEADLGIHFAEPVPGKPYVETEGTMEGYWGYTRREGYYNYINIGVYTERQRVQCEGVTRAYLERGWGFLFASSWLQAVPPDGPNHNPGGMGTKDDPGIRWWLEYVKGLTQTHITTKAGSRT